MRKFLGAAISFSTLTLIGVSVAGAQGDVPLELVEKVANFYDTSLGIGAILALGIITYGGILYTISAGNVSRQSDARKWITSALLGLLLLFGSFVIMAAINPQLTRLDDVVLGENIESPFSLTPIPLPPDFPEENLPPLICVEKGNRCDFDAECCNSTCLGPGICDPAVDDPTDLIPECREVCERKLGPGTAECLSLAPCPEISCPFSEPGYSDTWLACRDRSGSGALCNPDCGRDHLGTDIGAPGINATACGKAVFAVEDGILRKFRSTSGCGIQFQLFADSGKWYRYCHLQGYVAGISEGSRVSASQQIAYNGDSGNAAHNACHIHFEVGGWAASCGGGQSCEENPGCYNRKNNPVPVLNYACGLNRPIGEDKPPSACISSGQSCNPFSGPTCCDGSCPGIGAVCPSPTCVEQGLACSFVLPCCGSNTCRNIDGRPLCLPSISAPSCIPVRGTCGISNPNCCSPSTCDFSANKCCTAKGERCSIDADCCNSDCLSTKFCNPNRG